MTKNFREILIDFFSHPMRIFFLYASFFAILGAIVLLTSTKNFINFHQFIFLQLFCGCAFAGFLLNAMPDWTNYTGNLTPYSIIAFSLLTLSFILEITLESGIFIMPIFWLFLLLVCGYWLYKDRNTNNFNLIFVLSCILLISLFQAFFGASNYGLIHLYIAAIVIVGFRVSAVMAQLALDREYGEKIYVFLPNPILRNLAYFSFILLAFSEFFSQFAFLSGFLAIACGLIMLGRIAEWHHLAFFKIHYTIIHYLLLLGVGVFYVSFGIDLLFSFSHSFAILHGITILVLLGFIYLIFNVASLRHSGQLVLSLPLSSKIGFILLGLSCISRVVLSQFSIIFHIYIPSILLGIVFIIFFVKFYKFYINNPFSDDPK